MEVEAALKEPTKREKAKSIDPAKKRKLFKLSEPEEAFQ